MHRKKNDHLDLHMPFGQSKLMWQNLEQMTKINMGKMTLRKGHSPLLIGIV